MHSRGVARLGTAGERRAAGASRDARFGTGRGKTARGKGNIASSRQAPPSVDDVRVLVVSVCMG